MKLPRIFCLFIALGMAAPVLRAQDPKPKPSLPPLPPGPLIQPRADNFAQWTIAPVEASSLDASLPSQNKKTAAKASLTMVKTDKTILRRRTDESGQTWDTWCIGAFQITIWPDAKRWVVQTPPADPKLATGDYEDYSKTDFPAFDWLSTGNYAGIQKIKGREYILFKDSFKVNSAAHHPN